jgi:hypothetical protein
VAAVPSTWSSISTTAHLWKPWNGWSNTFPTRPASGPRRIRQSQRERGRQHFPDAACPTGREERACPGRRPSLPAIPFQAPRPVPEKLCQVRDYLILQRGLPVPSLAALIDSGLLYADARANAVFLLLGKRNQPVGAELQGTTAISWRGMASGSRKDLGFFAAGPAPATSVVLCESAIDAISCCVFHPQCRCLSTAGARPDPRWLKPLLARGLEVYCGFDADPAGEAMARAMIALYPSVRRLRPSEKDWNDLLRSR